MKSILHALRSGRDDGRVVPNSDDSLGRGMDVALTLLVFLGLGALVDRWLGVFPLFTIGFVLFAAIGTFIRMKVVYDATMERHEAARREATRPSQHVAAIEDVG